ncbi:hypothetical protein [Citreimonas salinaria]|uniref:Uncharacterized protein n=1 Tax=Citreimonas salinaria TaxID=321339 RepID=A0A1H3J9R2_9RHOB|nr:hypothetical protein [Citreimonas salinaria]SDY36537.1 hypothetical protein SAMN05444340_106142 [Citreimonas salinaria]
MYIYEGVGLLLVALVLYGWAYRLHHRPASPGWAKGQPFASAVGLVLVLIAPVGAGLLTFGLMQPLNGLQMTGLAVLIASPFALHCALRRIR